MEAVQIVRVLNRTEALMKKRHKRQGLDAMMKNNWKRAADNNYYYNSFLNFMAEYRYMGFVSPWFYKRFVATEPMWGDGIAVVRHVLPR